MNLRWSSKALDDVERLHDFLAQVNAAAAARITRQLVSRPRTLLPPYPRRGERLAEFDPREVRRLLIGNYEMRYEITEDTIFILRLWHVREGRR
jgi:plasmid stabilization system protein ParE